MSISITQPDNVGITVESDPLALKIASNLSDLQSTTTARTNLGLGAVATASFATNAETITGTSTTTVITPDDLKWSQGRVAKFDFMSTLGSTWTSVAVGSGFLADSSYGYRRCLGSSTQNAGYAAHWTWAATASKGTNIGNGCINWSKPITISFRLTTGNVSSDPNSLSRVVLGKTTWTVGDLSTRGVGLRTVGGTSFYQLCVHDGTTLTIVNSSKYITQSGSVAVDFRIVTDALGGAKLYADDVLIASTTGAPSTQLAGSASQSYLSTEVENVTTLTGGICQFYIYNLSIEQSN